MTTNQELKKLSRQNLLELLIEQCEENDRLKQELEAARKKMEDRRIPLEQAGSIAEASLQLNGVFEAAQKAADQYLENIRAVYDRQQEDCARLEEENRAICEQKKAETERYCRQLEQDTKEKCSQLMADAQRQSQLYWEEASKRVNALLDTYSGLRNILEIPFGKDVPK